MKASAWRAAWRAACLVGLAYLACLAGSDAQDDVEEVLISPYNVLARPPASSSTPHPHHHRHEAKVGRRTRLREHGLGHGHHRVPDHGGDPGLDLWDMEQQQEALASAAKVLTTRSVKQDDVTEYPSVFEDNVESRVLLESLAEIEHAISKSSSRLTGEAPRPPASTARPESLIGPWDLSRTVQILRRGQGRDKSVLASYSATTTPHIEYEAEVAKLEAAPLTGAEVTTPPGINNNEVLVLTDGDEDDGDYLDLDDEDDDEDDDDDFGVGDREPGPHGKQAPQGPDGTQDENGVMEVADFEMPKKGHVDIVTRFLRIVESQHLLGENCTAGTDLNLGEGVVDRYAQERFRVEADVAVNRANMLTRLWKYAGPGVMHSEYLLHAAVFAMVEFDDDIFAAGNCYDAYQYKDYWLFCPFAYRLPEGPILVKDLAVEYKYLGNKSEWFFVARKNAERVIHNYNQFSKGYNTYTYNSTAHTERYPDEILSVTYEDGKWSKPYYDCGGGNIWMLTYTVPFFGFANGSYFFKGTSGIDIDLRRVDIDQCPLPPGSTQLNIFAASDKCKKRTTECAPIAGLGFRRGSYLCVCRPGFYFPDVHSSQRAFNGSHIEEEYEKLIMGSESTYRNAGAFECLECAEGCEVCEDSRPCVVSLNWAMRTALLVIVCVIILCLPAVVVFTWKYGHVKVVRAASPVLLRVIALGAFFIYCTNIVMYFEPHVATCTLRLWLREIGFSLTYGALMLKTWRISVIFRVRSAKAVKITDLDLVKRVGAILGAFGVLLAVRTLVDPPPVIVGRTADDLKAFLCRTDWWDHCFTMLEVAFLAWGVRLCIVVRKAPSEFNESRFISMAIYNEFLLSVFLNVSIVPYYVRRLFLQSPANPDLLFVIFFCHTQLTITLLLGLIFGSKAYLVFRDRGRLEEAPSIVPKPPTAKFLRSTNSHYATQPTPASSNCTGQPGQHGNDVGVQEEFARLKSALDALRDRSVCRGDRILAARIGAMLESAGPGPRGGGAAPRAALREAEEDAAAAKANEQKQQAEAEKVAANAVALPSVRTGAASSPGTSSGLSPGLSSVSTPCPGSAAGRVDVATSPERALGSSEDDDDYDEADEDGGVNGVKAAGEEDPDSRRPAPPLTLKELRAVQRSFKRAAASSSNTSTCDASSSSAPSPASNAAPGGHCNGDPPRHRHHHHRHHHHHHHHRKHHHRHKSAQARSRSFEDAPVPVHLLVSPTQCSLCSQPPHPARCSARPDGRSASCPSSSQDSSPNGVISAPLVLDLDDKNRFTEEVAV